MEVRIRSGFCVRSPVRSGMHVMRSFSWDKLLVTEMSFLEPQDQSIKVVGQPLAILSAKVSLHNNMTSWACNKQTLEDKTKMKQSAPLRNDKQHTGNDWRKGIGVSTMWFEIRYWKCPDLLPSGGSWRMNKWANTCFRNKRRVKSGIGKLEVWLPMEGRFEFRSK